MCIIEYYKNCLHCPFNWFGGNSKFGKAFTPGCFVLACLLVFSTVTLLTTVIAFPSLIPLNSGKQHVGRYSTDCFSMIVPLMVVILTGFFPNNHFPFHQSYGTSSHTHLLLTRMFNISIFQDNRERLVHQSLPVHHLENPSPVLVLEFSLTA